MKILAMLILVTQVEFSAYALSHNKDFREKSIYQNTDLVFDKASGESKGTILLIHGTAPQNINGLIPIPKVQKHFKKNDPTHYAVQPTYKKLAERLNSFGWNTVRYTRVGVYQDKVINDEYAKTDLSNITNQLEKIWLMIPTNKPKIAFAWSGGSIHILQMSLKDAAGIIILGGIATRRTDVYKQSARNKEELKEVSDYLTKVLSMKGKVSRTKMMSKDMSYGRFFDENNLNENWTYLRKHKNLPTLILHGEADNEVKLLQAETWKKRLPQNKIKLILKPDRNHAFSKDGHVPDMKDLAETMNDWLSKILLD